MSELVTGEAVALELRPAKLPSRALAVLLDLAVAVAVYVAVTIALVAATSSLDTAAQTALSVAAFALLLVGAPIAVETLSHGRSLGKMVCGLRVVRDDGGPIRFRHALVRGLIGVIEILMTFGVAACIASLVSARGRRIGDVFAGTLVVRERVPAGPGGFVPPPPPWLAGRFSELDLSAVPDDLWLAVRQYLTRVGQLDAQVGQAMAGRLAADVAARTGAPVPQGVAAAAYLAAVLQERQAREARRAFGAGSVVPGGAVAAGGGAWSPVGGAPVPLSPSSPEPPEPPSRVEKPAEGGVRRSSAWGEASEAGAAESRSATGFVPPA
ncbi:MULTISPECIES: RDD family protein [Streptomyces]|uniref:RDD family membrane protein YckC n=2 Tax=Streptomyces TaxID=1883 RepID=A0ABT9LES1_STRGD|nr:MULTISPECIES: RDD family protein [Streptomyces]MDP9682159.1 putative RDD family membrane protein YckC [Streptomyces griseoviridis]GGS83549.1 membrane protein [Streptomyces griseoviridis]GGU67528.1 membrane protein [Streptomyces daghestanicus]GHI33839.1 membrane protein [Streptomyces daghestanicus]